MGANKHDLIAQYEDSLSPGGAVLEIGAAIKGGSTEFLYRFCLERGLPFFSYDTFLSVTVGERTGGSWLAEVFPKYKKKITWAYLDNFDWSYSQILNEGWYKDQVIRYQAAGFTLSNENSQAAHLTQAKLVAQYAAKNCAILFDDTWQTLEGGYNGKGGLAIPYLLDKGWVIVEQSEPAVEPLDGYVLIGKGVWR